MIAVVSAREMSHFLGVVKYFSFCEKSACCAIHIVVYCVCRTKRPTNMNLEHATPELFAALAKAQNTVENATKGSVNPHFKNRYADLAEVLNTVRPVFSSFGLSIVQNPSFDGSLVSVTTALCHEGGGYITAIASCVPAKADAQGVGSATTYLRRYSLASITGVAQEDDDGQSAVNPVKPTPLSDAKASKAEIAAIRIRMEALEIDEEAFNRHLGVTSIDALPKSKVQRANTALDIKQRKLSQEVAQ